MRALLVILLAACANDPEPTNDTSRVDAPWPDAEQEVFALQGEVTWHVDFHAAAESAGKTDCSYTRRYTAREDRSRPWLCRSCNVMLRADVEMVAGLDDCYAQVTEATPAAVEWVGYSWGTWWRSTRENRELGRSAATTIAGDEIAISSQSQSQSFDGYGLTFSVEGSVESGVSTADLLDGMGQPEVSECGWSREPIEAHEGGTRLRVSGLLPDAHLPDACAQGVRLHQFVGRYQVIAFVARDDAASLDFVQGASALQELNVDVESVYVLAAASGDPFSSTADLLGDWAEEVGVTSPVLGHRGYGAAVMADGDDVVWPVVAVVSPDLEVLQIQRQGFAGWPATTQAIEDHARR